jgi:hypothetical protein
MFAMGIVTLAPLAAFVRQCPEPAAFVVAATVAIRGMLATFVEAGGL